MYTERPDHMKYNDWLASQVSSIKSTLNGASNAMLITPFFTAANRDQLLDHLDVFADDIKAGAEELIRVAKLVDVTFDHEASGRKAIAAMLLQNPSEEKVRSTFDRARGAIWMALDGMKARAKEEAVIVEDVAKTALMMTNTLNNVVRGTQDFYRQVPASATEGFIFR